MHVFKVLLPLGAIMCSHLVSGHKTGKLVIGGAAAGGAGAIGAGGGFLAGSHIGSLLAKHGYGLHGHGHGKQILLPPKNIYLQHHAPVVHHEPIVHHKPVDHLHAAPAHAAPIAIKHEVPIEISHDHHHHHHHIEHEHHHEHHHAIGHAEIPHGAPIAPVAPIAEHGHFHVPAPHFHHAEHAHGPPHVKKPEALYKGNIVIKKKIPAKGHHFSIHGYQFSIGRKPKTLLHKKHFFFHPAPVIVKPFFVKEKAPALIKAAVPVPIPIKAAPAPIEHGPIVLIKGGSPGHGPAAGPWAHGPIIINEAVGPIGGHQQVIKEAAAPVAAPIIKEAVVEGGWPHGAGGGSHAPLIKILGPIFDAPLPVIGGHDAW